MDEAPASAGSISGSTGEMIGAATAVTAAIERLSQSAEPQRAGFELRDPFFEVTYRSKMLDEILAIADKLGSSRFVAIDAEGKRTPMQKIDGEWQLGPTLPARSDPPLEAERPTEPSPPTEREAQAQRVQAALEDRYLISRSPVSLGSLTLSRTVYRFRGDDSRVAFTESGWRLTTDSNSPVVVRSMVDLAEARGWSTLRLSGNDDFKRLVWLDAARRGIPTLGHEPNTADREALRRITAGLDKAVPSREPGSAGSDSSQGKASGRGSDGRKTVLAAIEAILVARGTPETRREAILAAASEQLKQRAREGRMPKVRVYEASAPSRRQVPTPQPEPVRVRDRPEPTR